MEISSIPARKELCGLLCCILAASAVAAGEMPNLLTTRLDGIDKTYPTWVSAKTASRSDGSLDPGLFHPALWDRLSELLEAPPDPERKCVPVEEAFQSWVAPPDVSSLEATFESAQLVLLARVTDRESGFDRGIPGQLIQITAIENFKGEVDLSVYYFFLPIGRFEAGNQARLAGGEESTLMFRRRVFAASA